MTVQEALNMLIPKKSESVPSEPDNKDCPDTDMDTAG